MVEKKDHSSSSNPTTYYDLLASKVSQLAQKERNLLQFDNVNIRSAVATASAIIMNVALKRALVLYEGVIVTAVSVSITAIGSHFALDKLLVQSPMFSDPDFCMTCTTIRGGFSQAVSSTILPIATSLAANAVIADRYTNLHIPALRWKNRIEAYRFWSGKLRSTKSLFLLSLGFQSLFGAYVAYKQSVIMKEIHNTVTDEELDAIANAVSSDYRSLVKYNG